MDLLRRVALRYVGIPYRWGGDCPMTGFDCSGLVQEILATVGEDPPGDQTAQALYDHFSKPENHSSAGVAPGAIAFYGEGPKKIVHVTFCLDEYRMLEAGGGGHTIVTLADAVKAKAYCRVRPIRRGDYFRGAFVPVYANLRVAE